MEQQVTQLRLAQVTRDPPVEVRESGDMVQHLHEVDRRDVVRRVDTVDRAGPGLLDRE